MGVDARIYVKGARPFDSCSEFVAGMGEHLSWWDAEHTAYTGMNDDVPWVEGHERYFGPGYCRGTWPHIRAAIMLALECFPGAGYTVSYGSDHDDLGYFGQVVTEELLAELDAAWQKEKADR